MYAEGEYDLAGFAVGVVSKSKIVDGARVEAGDVAIGLPSSGLHSNGYSLARKVVVEKLGLAWEARPAELGGKTVGEALLNPTRLYARHVQAMVRSGAIDVRAMSHVTGGGLPGNVPRVLPEGKGLRIDASWKRPGILDLIAKGGPVDESEMRRTFNGGIGFVFVVPPAHEAEALAVLAALGEAPIRMGAVVDLPSSTPFEERLVWPETRG